MEKQRRQSNSERLFS